MTSGLYEIHFLLGEYFKEGFSEIVPVRFRVADSSGHYHVPLVCSPWSYSTYRGSEGSLRAVPELPAGNMRC